MAILKQGHMKEDRTSSNPSRHLKVAIAYILKAEKCENGRLTGAVNCVAYPDLAYRQMMKTKREFGKLHGRQGYHYILSFTEGEITPEKALEITERFVQEYLQGQYEVVYAVHTDKAHVHAHMIFNSVGLDGYKYHAPKGEWRQNIMPIVNQLCEEYRLSEIRLEEENSEEELSSVEAGEISEEKIPFEQKKETVGENHSRWGPPEPNIRKKETVKNPLYGRKGSGYGSSAACLSAMLRRDIDECIGGARSLEEFYRRLEARGYRLRIAGNRAPALIHDGMERVRRFSSLGQGYSIEEIEARILSGKKPEPEPGISKDELPPDLRAIEEAGGVEPFQTADESIQSKLGREIFFCLLISGQAYSRAVVSSRAVFAYNDFYNLREAYEFVHKHNIQSAADVETLCEKYGRKLKEARNELRKINRSLSKNEVQSERFALLQEYHKLQDAVLLYHSGDESFYEDYLKAQKLLDRITETGSTLEESERELDSLTRTVEAQKGRITEAQEMLRGISTVKAALKRQTPAEEMEQLLRAGAKKNLRETSETKEKTADRTENAMERKTGKGRRI